MLLQTSSKKSSRGCRCSDRTSPSNRTVQASHTVNVDCLLAAAAAASAASACLLLLLLCDRDGNVVADKLSNIAMDTADAVAAIGKGTAGSTRRQIAMVLWAACDLKQQPE
jgi:acetylglutamate kinase